MAHVPIAQASSQHNRSAQVAAFDLLLILATLFIVKYVLLRAGGLWTYAGPISLLASIAVASLCLYKNGENWRELGLRKPENWGKLAFWSLFLLVGTIVAGIGIEVAASNFIGNDATSIDPNYANRFAKVPGNLPLYLYWIIVSWVVGGFVEEMLFRGILLTRFEQLFTRFRLATWVAIVLQAVIFGQQHFYYQGWAGALATGGLALISGVFYILLKRTMWPLILSHGTANMIGLTLIFTGIQPPS